ncbi:MAG: septum formation protein Maf [Verrucomicrobia bacterium]|nr:MAG: septum formation protein Maf [Verrucomicrobiota bacterium]
MRLILASSSPRRKLLLQQAGYEVVVFPSEATELASHPEGAKALAVANARLKVDAVCQIRLPCEEEVILGADTVVSLNNEVFGKPKDRMEAESMLTRLAGCWHEVITGICVWRTAPSTLKTEFFEITRVLFHPLKLSDIRSYLDSIHPYDKAGGYAAQEGGKNIIADIEGSFSNVVGLPMEVLQAILLPFRKTDSFF